MKMALRKIAFWASLTVLLVLLSTVEAAETAKGGVTFLGEMFKMTCPGTGDWYLNTEKLANNTDTYESVYDNKKKGPYHCLYDTTKKYYFYVKGKACKDCFELDPIVFVLAITLDLIVTAVLMMIIYKFGKRRSSGGSSNASRGSGRSGTPAPATAGSSTYEPLNPNTRNQDTYSKVNRMG